MAKEFKYDVRAYNLNVMDIIFNIYDEIKNKITFSAESVGIVGFFVKVSAKSKVEFNDKEKKTWKYEYRYEKPTSNKYRLNKINFSKEGKITTDLATIFKSFGFNWAGFNIR